MHHARGSVSIPRKAIVAQFHVKPTPWVKVLDNGPLPLGVVERICCQLAPLGSGPTGNLLSCFVGTREAALLSSE